MDNRFIVAEVSKNWEQGKPITGLLISQRFETVINTNFQRGYKLSDWKLTTSIYGLVVNETIIAIFEKINSDGK